MQRPRQINRANLLGIILLGLVVIALRLFASPSDRPERLVTEPSFLEEWWKDGQGNFLLGKIPQRFSAERRDIDRLISWKADPAHWSADEITDLSYFILKKSQEYQVPPILLLSLIEVESGYRSAAVSHRGAVGLMQLLPETAAEIAGDIGLEWTGPAKLTDPKLNIEFGLLYLTYLRQHFPDLQHVLTAYNMGPWALKRKLRSGEEFSTEYFERVMQTMRAFEEQSRIKKHRVSTWL